MSWVAIGITVGTAAVGAYQGNQKEKAQERQNKSAAEANRYSSWTGKSMGQNFGAEGAAMGGLLQGGLAGFGAGQSINANRAKTPQVAEVSAGGYDPTMGEKNDYWSKMLGTGPRRSFY
jgi:hypothetical protein